MKHCNIGLFDFNRVLYVLFSEKRRRLWLLENSTLRKIFGPRSDGDNFIIRRILGLYPSPNFVCDQIKEDEIGGGYGTYGEGKK
jgi:hypothetical protein